MSTLANRYANAIFELMEKLKISFDFDNTLDQKPMQELCEKFKNLGAEIFVTTSRTKKLYGGMSINNDDLFRVTDRLGIKRQNITFTNFEDKYLSVMKYDMHFDDSNDEIFLINEHPGKCMGFLFEIKTNNGNVDF